MTPGQVARALEAAEARYWAEVDRIAEAVTRENVAPFCDRHGVRFRPGMGSWDFDGAAAEDTPRRPARAWASWDFSELPAKLAKVLDARTIGGHSLGGNRPGLHPAELQSLSVFVGLDTSPGLAVL